MKRLLLAAALSMTAGATQASSEPYIGEVITLAGDYCPRGFVAMNGQLLSIAQNTALFSLLLTRYGGDGQTTFGVPTAKPVFTASGAPFLQCIAKEGIYPSRE